MYLLDSSSMERGTPQRRTVYRISLTLVKKESVEDVGGDGGSRPQRAAGGSTELQHSSGLLEQLKEVEDDELTSSQGLMRNFRTFSTGQLELGRLKLSRKLKNVEKKKKKPENGEEKAGKSNGKTAKVAPETPPLKRPPGLLRRSFSFRHWTGGSTAVGTPPPGLTPAREKSRTLEVGTVLLDKPEAAAMSELRRKNRTLDNSDLQWLAAGGKDGCRAREWRLTNFFSGIFSRREATATLGSPSASRCRRTPMSQSSTDSMNGRNTNGKHTSVSGHVTCDRTRSYLRYSTSKSDRQLQRVRPPYPFQLCVI